MRIYAVADIHGKTHHIAAMFEAVDAFKPEIIVAAGDLTQFFNWRTCLAQLESLPVPVLAIRGNTDFRCIKPWIEKSSRMTYLTPTPLRIQGLSFVGTSGTLILPFASRICLKERQALEPFKDLGPDTVMVVHPPPKGTLDRVGGRIPSGSRGLARFIEKDGPGLLLCGHIHEAPGQKMLGRTTVVNCSMSKKSRGAIIDIEQGAAPEVCMLQ